MKFLSGLSVLLACLLLSSGGLDAGDNGHTKDSLATVKKRVEQNKAVIVDVREKAEWEAGHLRDAKLLPLSELRQGVSKEKLGLVIPHKKTIVYLHCASGRRCLAAADLMKKMGFEARPLREGYQALIDAGFARAPR